MIGFGSDDRLLLQNSNFLCFPWTKVFPYCVSDLVFGKANLWTCQTDCGPFLRKTICTLIFGNQIRDQEEEAFLCIIWYIYITLLNSIPHTLHFLCHIELIANEKQKNFSWWSSFFRICCRIQWWKKKIPISPTNLLQPGIPRKWSYFFCTFFGPAHVGVRLHLEFLTSLIWTFHSL